MVTSSAEARASYGAQSKTTSAVQPGAVAAGRPRGGKAVVLKLLALADPVIALLLLPSLYLLKAARRIGLYRLPSIERAMLRVGVFPVRDHYYEPLFNPAHLKRDLAQPRSLPAVDLRLAAATELVTSFRYGSEFRAVMAQGAARPAGTDSTPAFAMGNVSFESGDADMWYSMIRHYRPRRIIEIGSGQSTLVARAAIDRNREEDAGYSCEHICVEPFENRWLEGTGARIHRALVEDLSPQFFADLGENDMLFIDSSHMIRPQGDVVFEYLELLPTLRPGVIVHIHDIFTPRDYLTSWIVREKRFWNEQYLLEAFLSFNDAFEVLLPVNHLHHEAYDALAAACAGHDRAREPGSFYIRRRATAGAGGGHH